MNIEDVRRKLQSRSHLRNVKIQPRIRNKEPTLKIESRSRSGDITYTCTRCKLLFFTFSSLDGHRENCQRESERHIREREAEYKCPEIGCLKVFLRTSTLKEHKNTHRSSLNTHPDKYSKIHYQNKNSRNVSHMENPNEFSQKKDPNEFSRKQYRNKFSLKQNPRDLSNRPPSRDFRQKHILRNFSQAPEQFSRPLNTQHPKTNPRYNTQYRQKYAREFSRSVSRNYDFNHNKQEKYHRQKESSPDQYLNASRDFSPNLVQIPNFEEYRSMLNNQKYKSRSSTNLNSNLKPYTSDTCKERKSDFKSFEAHLMNHKEEKNPKMVVDLDEEIIVDSEDVEMEEKKPTDVDLVDTEEILDLEETAAAINRELEELKWLDGEILDEYKEKNMNTLNNLHCLSNEVVEREIYFSNKVVEKEKEGIDMSDSVKEKPKIMVDLEEGEIVDSEDEDMGEKEAHSENASESPDVHKIIIEYKNILNNKKYEYKERNKQTSSLEKIPNYANLKKTSNLIVIPYKCDLCEERKSDFQSFQEHLMSHLEEKQPKMEIHPKEGGSVDSEDDQMEETEKEEMDDKEYECSIEKYQHHKIPSLFCLSLIQAYADEPSSTSDSLSANAPHASLTDKGSSQNDLLPNYSSSPNDFTNVSPSNESSPPTDSISACLTSASGVENREPIGPGLSLIQAYASPDYCPSPSYLGNLSPPNDSSSATDSSSSTDSSSACFTSSSEKKGRDKDETDIPTSVDSVDTEEILDLEAISTREFDDKILDESACFTSSPEKKGRDKDETDISTIVDSVDTEVILDLEAISTRELDDKILDEYKEKNANTLNNLHCLSNEVVEREIYFSNKVVENENEGVDVSGIVEKMIQEDIDVCTDLKKEFLQNKMHGLKSEFKEKNLNILSGLHLHNNEVIKGVGDNIPVDVPTNIKMDVIENKAKPDSIENVVMSNSDSTEYVEEHTWTLLENIAIPKCDFVELENIDTPKRDFVENIEWPKWNFSENIGTLKWDLIEYLDMPQHDVIQDSVALPDITPKMEKMIQKALKSRTKVLIDRHNIRIGARDIRNLAGLNWLNDEIINFYLQMIVERGARTGVKIHAYSTFFYPKLMTGGHTSLRRWTKKVDIFAQDLLLIPVHLGIHWSLAVVDFGKSGVFYYDSMGGDNPDCFPAILKYLQEEHRIKKEEELDVDHFEARTLKGVPQQMNGSDCGVFLLKFAEYVSRGADLNFTQKDMPTFRKIIWEILNDQLLQ